jgi:adenylylsulfate kinase-like enzyme
MAAPRDLATIDRDLKFVHSRRETNRRRISTISAEIIADTGMIDRLLAERSAATAARQMSLPATS